MPSSEKGFIFKINKVVAWVTKHGYDVDFGASYEDEMDETLKLITINSRFKPELQLYALLHECGHLLLRLNLRKYKKIYPYYAAAEEKNNTNKRTLKNKMYQIDVIMEELDAWRKGKILAKRLNINIDESTYNKEMAKWTFSHIDYAYECMSRKTDT